MNFVEYQKISKTTAIYPTIGHPVIYPTLGLAGETGEVVEKIKKLFRDNNGVLDTDTKELITKELGDILWYVSQICSELEISLDYVAKENVKKLQLRKKENKLKGSGDTR